MSLRGMEYIVNLLNALSTLASLKLVEFLGLVSTQLMAGNKK